MRSFLLPVMIPVLLLTPVRLSAEPVVVSIEFVEFDCSSCPELHDRYVAALRAAKHQKVLAELEKRADKRVLLRHIQSVEPGIKVEQSTLIDGKTFTLTLLAKALKSGVFSVEVSASLSEKRDPVGDRAISAGSSVETTVTLALGERTLMGGHWSEAISPMPDERRAVHKRMISMTVFGIEKAKRGVKRGR